MFISSSLAWRYVMVVYLSESFSSSYEVPDAHAPFTGRLTFFVTVRSSIGPLHATLFLLQEVT